MVEWVPIGVLTGKFGFYGQADNIMLHCFVDLRAVFAPKAGLSEKYGEDSGLPSIGDVSFKNLSRMAGVLEWNWLGLGVANGGG